MSSIRRITGQQFSDGTTIDGDRLEKALQDLEDYINDVPDGDFKTRWLQSQAVLKYLPFTAEADANLATNTGIAGNSNFAPYLPVYNGTVGGSKITNAYRFKGNKLSWQDAYNSTAFATQVAWTASLAVGDEPIVIDAIDLSMAVYASEYTNAFEYSSSVPPNKTPGAPIDDIHLQVSMDNPFIPSLQILNSVLYHKYNFSALNAQVTAPGLAFAIGTDINPTLASVSGTSGGNSLFIQEHNLNIPVPPGSRIRFSLIIPSDSSGYDPWGLTPWRTFVPTMTLTFLERLERD